MFSVVVNSWGSKATARSCLEDSLNLPDPAIDALFKKPLPTTLLCSTQEQANDVASCINNGGGDAQAQQSPAVMSLAMPKPAAMAFSLTAEGASESLTL